MTKSVIKKLSMERFKALEAALAADDAEALFAIDAELSDCVVREEWKHGFEAMSVPRARFLASSYLHTEVNNGGFHQFLLNKGPDAVGPALAILDERGPEGVAAMLRETVAALPGGRLPADNEELTAVLAGDDSEAIYEAICAIDSRFFDEDFDDRLIRARLEYVRDHAAEFFA